jgi:hypothetical protein
LDTLTLNHDHLTRQMSLIPMETLRTPVHVIGCGAIGSFATLALAKMGMTNINVYDMDDVSVENMSNQFFRFSDIGYNKASALQSLVKDFTKTHINVYRREFVPEDAINLNGIVISAVDSMKARRMIFEAIKEMGFAVKWIIDPRMSAEFYAQYTINPFLEADQKTYEKTLYTDEASVQERCTAKSTIYTATLAAGMVVKTIKDLILKADKYPRNTQWDISSCQHPMTMFSGNVSGPAQQTGLDNELFPIAALAPSTGPTYQTTYQIAAGMDGQMNITVTPIPYTTEEAPF